MSGFFANDLLK